MSLAKPIPAQSYSGCQPTTLQRQPVSILPHHARPRVTLIAAPEATTATTGVAPSFNSVYPLCGVEKSSSTPSVLPPPTSLPASLPLPRTNRPSP